jgi:hypothetical protein
MCDAGVDPNSIVAGGSAAGYAEETSFSQAFLGRITSSHSLSFNANVRFRIFRKKIARDELFPKEAKNRIKLKN